MNLYVQVIALCAEGGALCGILPWRCWTCALMLVWRHPAAGGGAVMWFYLRPSVRGGRPALASDIISRPTSRCRMPVIQAMAGAPLRRRLCRGEIQQHWQADQEPQDQSASRCAPHRSFT